MLSCQSDCLLGHLVCPCSTPGDEPPSLPRPSSPRAPAVSQLSGLPSTVSPGSGPSDRGQAWPPRSAPRWHCCCPVSLRPRLARWGRPMLSALASMTKYHRRGAWPVDTDFSRFRVLHVPDWVSVDLVPGEASSLLGTAPSHVQRGSAGVCSRGQIPSWGYPCDGSPPKGLPPNPMAWESGLQRVTSGGHKHAVRRPELLPISPRGSPPSSTCGGIWYHAMAVVGLCPVPALSTADAMG